MRIGAYLHRARMYGQNFPIRARAYFVVKRKAARTVDGQRPCRKCLLRDMDWTGYFQNLREYVKNLPEEDKVSDEEYERRLSVCRECEWLFQGMCRVCGCYVEMRAAMKARTCPQTPKLW